MVNVVKGDKVSLEYEGRLEDGQIFDSSKHGDHSHPLEFEVGSGMVIAGFDNAVIGMANGEEKEFTIEPDQAYGPRREELKKDIPKSSLPPLPEGQELKAGMALMLQSPQGQMPVVIDEVKEDSIVLDLNHPLAGKKLIFKIKILEINKSSK